MKIQKSEDNKIVQLQKDDVVLAIEKGNDYFVMSTNPYEGEITLEFNMNDYVDVLQCEVCQAFNDLVKMIIGNHYFQGDDTKYHLNKDLKVNIQRQLIAISGDSFSSNFLAIKYDENGNIILKIFRNPNDVMRNNRVIMDRSGALISDYYRCFDKFLNSLIEIAERRNSYNKARERRKNSPTK